MRADGCDRVPVQLTGNDDGGFVGFHCGDFGRSAAPENIPDISAAPDPGRFFPARGLLIADDISDSVFLAELQGVGSGPDGTGQVIAEEKRILTDGLYIVRQGKGCETETVIKRVITDIRYLVRNVDGL